MEIALWLVYADWGMLLLLLQPVAALIFIYIFPSGTLLRLGLGNLCASARG